MVSRHHAKHYAKIKDGESFKKANRAKAAKWRRYNPERAKESGRRKYLRNRDKIIARSRKWEDDNPEKTRINAKKFRARHREDINRRTQARRARLAGAPGGHSVAHFRVVAKRYSDRCVRCGGQPVTEDHIVPLSRGGSDSIANIQPLCLPCNTSKGARHTIDYRYELYDWMA